MYIRHVTMASLRRDNSSSVTSSPDLLVTACDGNETPTKKENIVISENCLAPKNIGANDSFSESDRYYTASSGEESDDQLPTDDDDDDDGLCIRLDSDDDNQSLSGLHINLKTLQAVSSMLAHYSPVIQSDRHGNPMFVAPAPPPEEDYASSGASTPRKAASKTNSARNSKCGAKKRQVKAAAVTEPDDYEGALQQLDDAIYSQDKSLLSDAMTELTNVMEKMTRYNDDVNDNQ